MRFLLLISLCLPLHSRFATIFGSDYQKAMNCYEKNLSALTQQAIATNQDATLLAAIVFPEFIRYSYFQDFLETKSLEFAYIEWGKGAADFSIGQCQMKPSFVEAIEQEVIRNAELQELFSGILIEGTENEQRRVRIARLTQIDWQFLYLSCFACIMKEKFAGKYFETEVDKVKFYAAAYNVGWNKKATDIEQQMQHATFPYGTKYSETMQYRYVDVAVDFFEGRTADQDFWD